MAGDVMAGDLTGAMSGEMDNLKKILLNYFTENEIDIIVGDIKKYVEQRNQKTVDEIKNYLCYQVQCQARKTLQSTNAKEVER